MKLVTYEVTTQMGRLSRIGVVLDENSNLTDDVGIVDLNFAYAALVAEQGEGRPREVADALMPPDMLKYMQSGPSAHLRSRQVLEFMRATPHASGPLGEQLIYARDTVKLLAPIVPRSARDYLTYEEHGSTRRDQKPAAFYYFPMGYKGTPQNFYGTDDPMLYPSYSEWMDPELELAFVINKSGRNIAIEDAHEYIGGYTIWVDCSARDVQARETLGPAKGKDWCTMLGPCITTPDAMDITTARCGITVNGEVWWEGRANQKQHYGPEEMVAWASDHENLGPGDLIVLGTIAFGCSIDIGRWVKPGDLVEHWIEGIGTMKTTVVPAEGSRNYVRDGLPGHLPIPTYGPDYLKDLADSAALRTRLGHSSPRPDEIAAGAPIKTLAHLQRV